MKRVMILLMIFACVFSVETAAFADKTEGVTDPAEIMENTTTLEGTEVEGTIETVDDVDTTETVDAAETTEPTEKADPITEMYSFTGKLYYCDTPTNMVVLRAVNAMGDNVRAAAMAKEAEYLEIRLSPDGIFMGDGSKNSIMYLNTFVDSDVWLIIARTAGGDLTIPYFQFR